MIRLVLNRHNIASLATTKATQDALLKIAEVGVEGAQRRAPVDTGELRASIHTEIIDGVVCYGSEVRHALPQEVGTWKMSAQPYLRPSLDDIKRVL